MAKQHDAKRRIRSAIERLVRDQRGNTYFLVAAATLPMIGIVGSGVDIGRAYMADLRLQQACDAGALAGRRSMVGTTYTAANKAEATKMFNINYDTGLYGSSNITFNTVQDGPSNVKGTASAKLPTSLMKVFGQEEFNLSVNCTAKLEISNVDVMLVLDVTGSMGTINSGDTVTRLQALKTATMNFFDTLTGAQIGDGRIRFGVVPYNFNVNVGQLLVAADPDWINNEAELPSREPDLRDAFGAPVTAFGTPYDGPISVSVDWEFNGGTINGYNASTCSSAPPPADSTPTRTGSSQVQTGQYFDGDGNRITTYDNIENFRFYSYRYVWGGNPNRCRRQRQTKVYTRTTPSTVTEPLIKVFAGYKYVDRTFDVSGIKNGGTVSYNVGDNGTMVATSWNGCIIERDTVDFDSTTSAPSDAYDMDIDTPPTSDTKTQWRMQLGDYTFKRNTPAPQITTSDRNSEGWNNCPIPAMKLTPMTSADRATFNTYIQSLTAAGNTYHDAGMTWGARLISPEGIFASENQTAPNGRTVQRHLIFMTDGEMFTNRNNLSFQGHELSKVRVGSTGDTDGNARHTNRFLQVCAAIQAHGVTVWTIDFDSTHTPSLVNCASGTDKAFTAINAPTLNSQFQAIARQISKLRLYE